MNFLAHLTLSNHNEDIMLGNFIADAVRSSQWEQFKPEVVMGIRLHHKIDFFTDNHPIVEQSKKRLRPHHAKYSPVVADILYDHFLARNFEEYEGEDLATFAERAYDLFYNRWDELPVAIQHILPPMKRGNWLLKYADLEGLRQVFLGMSRRASFPNQMERAVQDLVQHYELFEQEFTAFYPRLSDFAQQQVTIIAKD